MKIPPQIDQEGPKIEEQENRAALAAWRGRCSDLLTYWAQGSTHYLRLLGMDRLPEPRYEALLVRANETLAAWLEEAGCTPKNSLSAVPIILGDQTCMALLIAKGWLPPRPMPRAQARPHVTEAQRQANAERAAREWSA